MRALAKDRVLRVNCPGYGVQSYFTSGYAGPLDNYDVVIVNPVSILHLFDKDPELLQQIEAAQTEGMTSHVAKSDKMLESITTDVETRVTELAQLLERGGLLIYFLCPQFFIQAPTITMDNYLWLDVLAPVKAQDNQRRNMSSASRGKNMEVASNSQDSPFVPYFKQPGVEWTTLIRAENLAEGYAVLASSGPNKCIAGQLDAGDNGGQVIFLPAPYHTEFDNRLMDCINTWLSTRPDIAAELARTSTSAPVEAAEPAPMAAADESSTRERDEPSFDETVTAEVPRPSLDEAPESKAEAPVEPKAEAAPEPKAEAPMEPKAEAAPLEPKAEAAPEPKAEATPEPKAEATPEPKAEATPEPKAEARPEPKAETKVEPPEAEHGPEVKPAAEHPVKKANTAERTKPTHEQKAKSEPQSPPKQEQSTPKPKDLMEKMEEISKPATPEWCMQYSFQDLDNLREELMELNEQVRLTQVKITEVEGRISTMEWLKNALLSSEGDELHNACSKVFEHLGWRSKKAEGSKDELLLLDGEWTVAIAKVVRTTSQVKRADLAQLAESVITYWGEHETEPKGIMVASTWANRPPSERTESDFTDALAEFASKKHLCLMTTWQLLCIYRDVESGALSSKDLREQILSTSGRLPGFVLDELAAAAY